MASCCLRSSILVQPGAKHLHRFRAVLDLRLLVLLRDDETGGYVREAHRRISRIDALAAGSTRAERVDSEILLVDLDIHLFGFRQDGDRDRRRVDSAARFRCRDALYSVDAAFVLSLLHDASPFDRRDHLFQPADACFVARQHLDPPPLAPRELAVHPEQFGGK